MFVIKLNTYTAAKNKFTKVLKNSCFNFMKVLKINKNFCVVYYF